MNIQHKAILSMRVIHNSKVPQRFIYQKFPQTIVKNLSNVQCYQNPTLNSFRQFSFAAWPSILSTAPPVLFLQDTLIQIHGSTGLPWWSVIMLTTISLRAIVTLPLAIHQHQVITKLENLKNEMGKVSIELTKEVSIAARVYNWDFKTSERTFKTAMKEYYKKFILRDNCHPAKIILLVLVQVPTWICFSAALRNICYMMPYQNPVSISSFMQMKSEGTLWFPDLTMPDPFLLPLLIGIINLTLIEMSGLRRIAPPSFFSKLIQNFLRGLTLLIVFTGSFSSSCITLYWICSSSFGLFQNILLMLPKVRRAVKIPLTASEASTPFTDIWNNLKIKMKKKH